MRLEPTPFAHVPAAISAIAFVLCLVAAQLAPAFFVFFWDSWFHGFDLAGIATRLGFHPLRDLFGLLTFTASGCVGGWLFAQLYNYFLVRAKQ